MRGPMTPRGAALPLVALSIFLLAAGLTAAQGEANTTAPSGDVPDYAVSLFEAKAGSGFAWSIKELSFPAGSKVALTYNSSKATAPHNVHAYVPELGVGRLLNPDEGTASISFTMPASGEVKFKCDVHAEMQGVVKVGAFTAGGAPETAGIEHVGVHYLAYWVAVIAFAVLFIIYGLTFFLFKNGESNATTDHMDRPGAATGDASGNRLRTVTVVLVTIVLVAGGLVLAFLNMPAAG